MPEPRFPLYIPSKGRHDNQLTMKALTKMKVPHYVVVEEQELELYKAALDLEYSTLLVLEERYQREYETCDDLGMNKPLGAGPARNQAWDHSIANGFAWHWVMDDNIRDFQRLNRNEKVIFGDGTCFYAMEEFCLRYRNIGMAGPQYAMFIPRKVKVQPLSFNTRIYSCNFIRNDVPFRWRSRLNDDTDLSLRILKAGWVTVLFNAFLQSKIATMKMKGGYNDAFYKHEGRLPASETLVKLHPDVAKLNWRFGRVHHFVDYRPFRKNKLIRKENVEIPDGPNDFGMKIVPTPGYKKRRKAVP